MAVVIHQDFATSGNGAPTASKHARLRWRWRKQLLYAARSMNLVLLLAAAGSAWKFTNSPVPLAGEPGVPGFEPALIAFEVFLGLWLISGALPTAARRVAIGCFSVFGCYTFYEALAGKTDCGCFGQVHVNPWFTFILDVAIVLALAFLAKAGGQNAARSLWSKRKWPVAVAAGIGLAVGGAAALWHPKVVSSANGFVAADNGRIVILEPQHWLGRRLPVLSDISAQGSGKALGNRISVGQWTVMFYHASCDECRATIPVYEQLAQQETLSGKRAHVAFVRVPTGSGASTRGLFHSDLPLHATLDAGHQWFATTPIVVELRDGIVHRVATGRSAMNPQWMNTAAYRRETAGGIDAVQLSNGQ